MCVCVVSKVQNENFFENLFKYFFSLYKFQNGKKRGKKVYIFFVCFDSKFIAKKKHIGRSDSFFTHTKKNRDISSFFGKKYRNLL